LKLTISIISVVVATSLSLSGLSALLTSEAPTLVRTSGAFVALYGLAMVLLLFRGGRLLPGRCHT